MQQHKTLVTADVVVPATVPTFSAGKLYVRIFEVASGSVHAQPDGFIAISHTQGLQTVTKVYFERPPLDTNKSYRLDITVDVEDNGFLGLDDLTPKVPIILAQEETLGLTILLCDNRDEPTLN